MNNTNKPPKKTKNKIYENQYELMIIPLNKHVNIVWIKIINPIDKGWLRNNINKENNIIINDKIIFIISKNSLIKIIILEIIDKEFLFLWSF